MSHDFKNVGQQNSKTNLQNKIQVQTQSQLKTILKLENIIEGNQIATSKAPYQAFRFKK